MPARGPLALDANASISREKAQSFDRDLLTLDFGHHDHMEDGQKVQ